MKTLSIFLIAILLISCAGKTPDVSAHMPVAPAEQVSGGDMYYDLLQTGKMQRAGQTMGDMHTRIFLSAKGEARVERDGISVAGHKGAGMVLIGVAGKTMESLSIDAEARTYTVNHFKPEDFKGPGTITSTVNSAGEENILGFHCVRVRIISKKNYGSSLTMIDTLDLWKSKDVPVPPVFGDWMAAFENKSTGMIYSPDVPDKLKQMGCVGFTVRMDFHEKSSSTSMVLVKAEHRDLAEELFKIPTGYTELKEDR